LSKRPRKTKPLTTGVSGLDTVLGGGFLAGRPTLIRGASGAGKSNFALMFAAANSPTVFATFDEAPERLKDYAANWGLGSDLSFLDFRPDPEMLVSGEVPELGGMLVRIDLALKKAGAACLVMDAIDVLFEAFENRTQIRRELHRVINWCVGRGVTLVATSGVDSDYRASTGILDYIFDCVILLDRRNENGLVTRILNVLKLRGTGHGTNEYPFLIDDHGISLIPVTGIHLSAKSSNRRLSTGIAGLDRMLGERGVWEGSVVMFSGQSGTGKSIFAISMCHAACNAGKTAIYASFEEAPEQIIRNAKSIGIALKKHTETGNLNIVSVGVAELGVEEHIIRLARLVDTTRPDLIFIDPISSLGDLGDARLFKHLVLRLLNHLKASGTTVVLTELIPDNSKNVSHMNVSSVTDTWVRVNRVERDGQYFRSIHVHKSRGSATSDKVVEFQMTKKGLLLGDTSVAA